MKTKTKRTPDDVDDAVVEEAHVILLLEGTLLIEPSAAL